MIKAVLLDFGQTLVNSANGFRKAEKEGQTKIFKDLGLESWPEFLSNYRRLRQDFHANSNFSRMALWQEVYLHYNHRPDSGFLLKIEHGYWQTVRSKTKLFPEAKAVLEQLVSEYRLALITNTQGQQTPEKHRFSFFPQLERFFEVIMVAGEAGLPAKPNREPFLRCLEKLGLTPNEVVYVGDDWRIDICGAKEAGIQPIWLQHRSVPRQWPIVETSVPVITSLEQLLEIVPIINNNSWSAHCERP